MQSTPPQENTQPYPTRRIKIPPFPQSPFKPNVTSNQTSADINNISTAENSPNTKTISSLKFPSKTSTLPCFALNLLEQKGSIQSFKRGDTFYIIKLQKVNIEDNYLELLDKGKTNLGNYFEQEIGSIPDISFWHQRYYYYTEFDKGIKMDYESWYSVTPEPIAKYIANIVNNKTVIDGFCGSGGNVIQFSKYCSRVYAVDIDQTKIDICKNNCSIYNCENNIEFILGDYLDLKGKINADFVFLSPPWGGLKYKDSNLYSIKKLMTPSIYDIVRVSLSIAKNILFYVPRNLDLDELFDIVSQIKNELEPNNKENKQLFFDIRILKSNRKIKCLLIIFGLDVNNIINDIDLKEYFITNYEQTSFKMLHYIVNIVKVVGCFKFFQHEYFYKSTFTGKSIQQLINYFLKNILTTQEKEILFQMNEKLKQHNIIPSFNLNDVGYNNKLFKQRNNISQEQQQQIYQQIQQYKINFGCAYLNSLYNKDYNVTITYINPIYKNYIENYYKFCNQLYQMQMYQQVFQNSTNKI
jgi:predicted RNA methylase